MNCLKKCAVALEKIQITAGVILLSIFFISILLQVFSRNMLIVISWTEEVANYSFIWTVFMGASVMVWHKAHFAFNYFRERLKGNRLAVYNLVINAIMLCFTLPMLCYGIIIVTEFWDYNWINLPNVKMGYTWLCVPITGAATSFYLIVQMLEDIAFLKEGSERA